MSKLGFIQVGDLSTATLINRSTKEVMQFECYHSHYDIVNDIFSRHFNLTPEGYLEDIMYPGFVVNISQRNPIHINDFTANFSVQRVVLDTLVSMGASEVVLLKFICDINNLNQEFIFANDLYLFYKRRYCKSPHTILNMSHAVCSKYTAVFSLLGPMFGPDYEYHWVQM